MPSLTSLFFLLRYPFQSYDSESILRWVSSNVDHRPEHSHQKESKKPYEEINKIVFEDTKFHIKTWHKVAFFLVAGIGTAAVSYVIKHDLDSRHNNKAHIV